MSRYVLTAACADGAFRYHAGQTLADSQGNAVAGDRISAKLCASPFAGMVPLDASAVSALAGVGISTSIGTLIVPVTGASSVDA
ncbi:MAG: hypothetical protein WA322_01835 [Pseudolabrys sp.]